jgi:hypothetical protein
MGSKARRDATAGVDDWGRGVASTFYLEVAASLPGQPPVGCIRDADYGSPGSGIGSIRLRRNAYPAIPSSKIAVAVTNAEAKEWVADTM